MDAIAQTATRRLDSPLHALGYPLGSLVFLYIVVTATLRGRRVAWKGRDYRHA